MLRRIAKALHLAGPMEDPTEAEENAASIDAIPADVPTGDPLPQDVRAALRACAAAGFDVYAYHAVGLPEAWYVWVGHVIDERSGYHGVRLPVETWRTWADLFRRQDGGAA